MMEDLQVSTSSDDFEEMDDCSLGGRVIVVESSPKSAMNYEKCEDKAQEIRECLQLHSESCGSTVDLWELRQLAISPGGLLSPTFRQVAWPLLVGLPMSKLGDSNNEIDPLDEKISESMQKDIEACVWNLEELVRRSQTGKDAFWYTPMVLSHDKSTIKLDSKAPSLILSSPCSSSETSHDESRITAISIPTNGKPLSGPKIQDQILLKAVLRDAVQGQPEYPRAGLANLASLCMINLESTSVASLLLSQLASYPLKAAFGGATLESTQTALKLLMEQFQPQHKQEANQTIQKALSWFSGFLPENLQASSRLIDAFLVGHPLFPLYFGVAAVDAPPSWNAEKLEELIAKALEYMEVLPPGELIVAASASSCYSNPPTWALAATAAADWVPKTQSDTVNNIPSTDECQQDEPFSDEDSNSDWEKISTISETGAQVLGDDASNILISTKEAFFLESYRLAMTAAGLGLASSKKSRSLQLLSTPEPSSRGHGYLKLVLLLTSWIAILTVGLSQQYSAGTPLAQSSSHISIKKAKVPLASSPRRSMGQRKATLTSNSGPTERFLGIVSVERPAPKKVLRETATSKALALATKKTTGPARKQEASVEKIHKEKIFGVLPAERPPPKTVLRIVTSNTVTDPTYVPPFFNYLEREGAPIEAYKAPAPSPPPASPTKKEQPLAFEEQFSEKSKRKFQPLQLLKKQLPKVKNLWSRVATFARRHVGKQKSVEGRN